jgi:hypothetical protein
MESVQIKTKSYFIYNNTMIQNNSHKCYTTIMHKYTTNYSSVRSNLRIQSKISKYRVTDRGEAATLMIEKEKKDPKLFFRIPNKTDMICTCTTN